MVSNTATAERRIVRLADIEAVKWVTGCFRDRSMETRRLTAEEIAEIADIEMHQPYPAEPGTWANVSFPDKYITVMAIVATEDTERGAKLVAEGQTYTTNQVDGLAIGCYAEQQARLASETGECSDGCCQANTIISAGRIAQWGANSQVCRHTLRSCRSCGLISTEKRIELLERLLINARRLFRSPERLPQLHQDRWGIQLMMLAIIWEIDGETAMDPARQAGPTAEQDPARQAGPTEPTN